MIDPNSRTFIVEVYVPKSLTDLKPNMLVKLSINDYTNSNGLVVPLKAVQKTADASFLFVAQKTEQSNDNIWVVEKRIVQTGMYYENKLEIKNGIEDGEFIIVTGFHDLANNEKVRLASSEMKTSMN